MTKQKPTVIILMGPPGSGKGTQAKRLMQSHQLPQVATGDLVRNQIARGTDMGKKLESYVNNGKFPPDKLILEMLAHRIAYPDCKGGFILDGFPRNKEQAKTLDKYMKMYGIEPIVIAIDVPAEAVKARMLGRVICDKCHAPFHEVNSPPKVEGVCDHCAGHLIRRADDSEKVIDYRLEVYKEQTEPLIKYYQKDDRLTIINGLLCQEEVTAQIEAVIAKSQMVNH
jgi:adenylate kinase